MPRSSRCRSSASAVGVDLPPTLHLQPLLIAAGVGLIIAFAFSYLPLLQALAISPVTLFRAKGLAAQPIEWARWLRSILIVPLIVAVALFFWLATLMTDDPLIVGGFALGAVLSVVIFRLAIAGAMALIERLPDQKNSTLRNALRGIAGAGSNAPSVVVSVGLALATLVVVLVLQLNLSNEYLGASVFDAPTFVASDLFDDEAEALEALEAQGTDVTLATATPMLRGLVTRNQRPPDRRHEAARPRGIVPPRGRSADDLPHRASRQLQGRRRRVVGRGLRRARRSSRSTRASATASASTSATT